MTHKSLHRLPVVNKYLSISQDKSTEKLTFGLNGHRIPEYDPTIPESTIVWGIAPIDLLRFVITTLDQQ